VEDESMRLLTLAFVGCFALAGVARAGDKVTTNDLKQLGLAYHTYHDDSKGKAPTKADDLAPHIDKKTRDKILGFLKSGQVVFIYNVRITDMKMGTSNTVLAYEKDAPKSGGLVLYGDGSVRMLTADGFKKATLAKPKTK
jgi:hypothetical protein